MAFLDNSGDIILDAVLTDLGREKMAGGNFTVRYFALGDDEVDYTLYNKNHPSGSAYYDLEILQTPVLEAFTQTNAAINYGLLSTEATELLYLPVMATNNNPALGTNVEPRPSVVGGGGVYWVTDNTNDARSSGNPISEILNANTNIGTNKYMKGLSRNQYILAENGLNTNLIKGTAENTTRYLSQNGLVDDNYYVYYDHRFINTVYGARTATLSNITIDSGAAVPGSWAVARTLSIDLGLENYTAGRIPGHVDEIYYAADNTVDDKAVSAIAGPRGNFVMLNISPKTDLGEEYSLFGSRQSVGFSQEVQYIDTVVYLQGAATGATLQLPIRIVRVYVA